MSKIKFLAATCLSTSLLLSTGVTNVTQAEEINLESQEEKVQLSQEQLEYMTSFLNKYNVDAETQLKLIEKVENGILLDCYSLDKQPINTYTIESDNVTEFVDVYEDGSINVSTIDLSEAIVEEVPQNETLKIGKNNNSLISPRAIDVGSGSAQSGSGYTIYNNAYVNGSSLLVRAAGFYANFVVVQGVGSYITYIDQAYTLSLVGGYSNNESLTLVNAKETSSQPAEAILKWTYVAFNGGGSTTCWVKLRLQNGKATSPTSL